MCTGYVQRSDEGKIKWAFDVFSDLKLEVDRGTLERLKFDFRGTPFMETRDRYIGYPSLVFRMEEGKLAACPMRWGLLARNLEKWEDAKKEKSLHNARSEGIMSKWPWRFPCKDRQTCLIICDWFRESGDHPSDEGKKRPRKLHYRFADEVPMFIAGLWNSTTVGDESVQSMTMITSGANETVGRFHDRMPCVLERDSYSNWLNAEEATDDEFKSMLKVYEKQLKVSRMSGYTLDSDDAPELIMEKGDPEQMGLL